MRCCSSKCKRKNDCGLHYLNSFGTHQIEDFSSFGSASISDSGIEESWWCGPFGDYNMYEPVKFSREEFIAMHCSSCGASRCEGIGTEWFEDCKFKNQLYEM